MNSNVGKTIASNRYSSSSSSSCRVENIQHELFRRRPKPCSSWEESWARGSTAIDAQFRLSPPLTPVRQAIGSVTCGGGGCRSSSQNAPHYFLAAFSCFLFLATSVLAQNKDGEPVAGGVTEDDIRFLLPPSDQTIPDWTDSEKDRGYVVYTDIFNNAMWPEQVPNREQIVDGVACRLARDEYEPIQIGVFGVGNTEAIKQVSVAVDLDLPAEVRFMKYRERPPRSKHLKYLGPTLVPYHLRLGDTHETIEPGHTGAFWITVHAAADATPGEHTGSITISVDGKPDTTLNLTVEVLPIVLPKPDIVYGMYYYRTNALLNDEDYVVKTYHDQAAHGMNSSTFYVQEPIRYEDGRLIFPPLYEERLNDWLEHGLIRPDVPIMLNDYQLVNWSSGHINDNLSAEQKMDVARHYAAYTRAQGFPEFIAYVRDEPSLDQPDSYFPWITGWKKSSMRTISAMSGEASAGFGHLHDVWVVHTGQITRETVREAWRQGSEVWSYTFAMGAYNVHSNRYMAGLYTWALGLRGNFHWAYFHNDHFVILEKEGPDPLMSWEGRREGIDDYRYLMLLETLVDRSSPDNTTASQARAWLDKLRAGVDLQFFHGLESWVRVDGPFCYPAPDLELKDYDRIRAKAADYGMQLGADKLDRFAPLPYVRSGAAKWEAQPFERATVDGCIDGLSEQNIIVRRAAAASLAERGVDALLAADKLKSLLSDPDVRLVAARALGAIGPEADGSADALGVLLDDDDAYVRMVGALSLGSLGEQSVASLRKALGDREAQVISIAGEALAELGPAALSAMPDLIPMIDSEVELVRRAAYKVLAGIGPPAAPATTALLSEMERQGGNNSFIVKALGSIGPAAKAAIPALEKVRDIKSASANANAALFRIRRDKADLDAIVELLRDPENSSRVWEYAANVLEDLGAEAAPVADDIRAFLKEQGDEFAQKQSSTVGQLRQYLDKVK